MPNDKTGTAALFKKFLKNARVVELKPNDLEVAKKVADGVMHKDIATDLEMSIGRVREAVVRIRQFAQKDEVDQRKEATVARNVAELKRTRLPFARISTEGLLWARYEVHLTETGIRTLGDIAALGLSGLRARGITEAEIADIEKVFAQFGVPLEE